MLSRISLCIIGLLMTLMAAGQSAVQSRQTIAYFLPLYLDSTFDDKQQYNFGKQFPKHLLPGLEFYEGVQLALDTLSKSRLALDVQVYDTKSKYGLSGIFADPAFQTVDLIIGFVNVNENRQLAHIAKQMGIPFINVNLPNNGGVEDNASLVVLNTTIETHCQSIYKYLQRNHATQPIVYLRKAGALEDRLLHYFNEAGKRSSSVTLDMQTLLLQEGHGIGDVQQVLDSNQKSVIVVGSLDENYTRLLLQQLAIVQKKYPLQVIGMPTLDGIKDLSQSGFRGLDVLYSTPFYYGRTDKLSAYIQQYFRTQYFARPSDWVFRGYDVTARFARLLLEHGRQLSGSIGEKKYKVFTDFDIQPYMREGSTPVLDYFENRKLYFVRKVDGVVKSVQ